MLLSWENKKQLLEPKGLTTKNVNINKSHTIRNVLHQQTPTQRPTFPTSNFIFVNKSFPLIYSIYLSSSVFYALQDKHKLYIYTNLFGFTTVFYDGKLFSAGVCSQFKKNI